MPATVVYLEIPAPDFAGSKRFYAGVFGWQLHDSDVPGMEYAIVSGAGLDAALDGRKQPSSDGVLIYLKVENIPASLARIAQAGGRELQKKAPVVEGRDFGFFAVFSDPCGNRLGLWART